MADYIPASDGAFQAWQINFRVYVAANSVALGVSAGDVTTLNTNSAAWSTAYNDNQTAQIAAKAATVTKNEQKDILMNFIRVIVAQIQANPAVTNTQRQELGITIPDVELTPVGPPTEVPGLFVEFSQRRVHLVHWGPNPQNEKNNPKPIGVHACELRYYIGDVPEPVHEEMFHFAAIDTSSPYLANLEDFIWQKVTWVARYLNAKGEFGTWSAAVQAEVTS